MDESNNDYRLISVPAREWPSNSKRPVYRQQETYPRHVGADVSKSYKALSGQNQSQPIGYIDQVKHTYGRYEASYASLNEVGVAITESTCGAKTVARPVGTPGGKALFWVGALSQIALERCATARCAVQTMGDLAVKHGFYGEAEVEGSGEALLVADPFEAFVFHILSTPDGASAIWCAQRVPDDHVTVVANMYTIRSVNLTDSENFLFSSNMLDVAKAKQWWDGTLPFDFTRAYSSGEYGHDYYSGRRMWRVLSLMAPSLELDATLGVKTDRATYPWSVKPEELVTMARVRALNRDHYEGTPYDMTKGMAAGPFGSPNRNAGGSRFFPQPDGAWERPIAMYRTSYSLIAAPTFNNETAEVGGVLWYSPQNPHASAYVPFFTIAAGHEDAVPAVYSAGSQMTYSRRIRAAATLEERAAAGENAWWASLQVMNWMDRMYSFMLADVELAQTTMEQQSEGLVAQFEGKLTAASVAMSGTGTPLAEVDAAVKCQVENAVATSAAWWELADNLTMKWNDGYLNAPAVGDIVGYPAWWLERVGYTKFPKPPPPQDCTEAAHSSNGNAPAGE